MSHRTDKRYAYEPSLPAGVIFVSLFAMTTGLHLYQMTRIRTWFFLALCSGGLLEFVGYICRVIASTETNDPDYSREPFIIQTVFLLVAPALIATEHVVKVYKCYTIMALHF